MVIQHLKESDTPKIIYYNNIGSIIWTKKVEEPRLFTVTISNHYVIATTKNSQIKRGFVYLYDIQGNKFLKDNIGSDIGNYEIEFSDESSGKYFATSTINEICLFNLETMTKIKNISLSSDKQITSFKIDDNGTVYITILKKFYSQTNNKYVLKNKELIVEDISNNIQTKELENEGIPSIIKSDNTFILKMKISDTQSEYYEILL